MPRKRTKYRFTTFVEGERKRLSAKPNALKAVLRGVGSLMDLTGGWGQPLAAIGDSGKYVVTAAKGERIHAAHIVFHVR